MIISPFKKSQLYKGTVEEVSEGEEIKVEVNIFAGNLDKTLNFTPAYKIPHTFKLKQVVIRIWNGKRGFIIAGVIVYMKYIHTKSRS